MRFDFHMWVIVGFMLVVVCAFCALFVNMFLLVSGPSPYELIYEEMQKHRDFCYETYEGCELYKCMADGFPSATWEARYNGCLLERIEARLEGGG